MSLAKHIFALVLFASRADAGNMVEPLVNLELKNETQETHFFLNISGIAIEAGKQGWLRGGRLSPPF